MSSFKLEKYFSNNWFDRPLTGQIQKSTAWVEANEQANRLIELPLYATRDVTIE